MTLQDYAEAEVKLAIEINKLQIKRKELVFECLSVHDRQPILSTVSQYQAEQELDLEAIKLPNDIKAILFKHRNKTQDTVIIPLKLLTKRYSHELKLYKINDKELIKELQCTTQGHKVRAELVKSNIVVM